MINGLKRWSVAGNNRGSYDILYNNGRDDSFVAEVMNEDTGDSLVHTLEVGALSDSCGGYWENHPTYCWGDWAAEVADQNTRQSYWEWVHSQLENEEQD